MPNLAALEKHKVLADLNFGAPIETLLSVSFLGSGAMEQLTAEATLRPNSIVQNAFYPEC